MTMPVAHEISFADTLRVWARIGCLSFGGPAGQIALMQRELVDERGWISEKDFLSALNFCMLLPGPEAMQLATYVGWKTHGVRGGLAAGLLFIIPGAIIVLALSMIYAAFGKVPWIEALFYGVKAAVLAIVIEALLRVAKRALKLPLHWMAAAVAFLALFVFNVPFPIVVIAAGIAGFIHSRGDDAGAALPLPQIDWRTALVWLAIWLVPLGAIALFFGPTHVFTEIGVFFSKLAVVTFGGAYAVLSYMGQAAVEDKGWLTSAQMIDGLGLAETTPGPLILVTQFVGYLAGLSSTGSIWGGIIAALITLWMTFVPSFMFIFVGAPYVEALNARPRLKGALSMITAAVVGVILNLSLWFGLHVLFGKVERREGYFQPWLPEWSQLDVMSLGLSAVSAVLLLRLHFGVFKTLGVAALLGLLLRGFG
jgi:chromate transporter